MHRDDDMSHERSARVRRAVELAAVANLPLELITVNDDRGAAYWMDCSRRRAERIGLDILEPGDTGPAVTVAVRAPFYYELSAHPGETTAQTIRRIHDAAQWRATVGAALRPDAHELMLRARDRLELTRDEWYTAVRIAHAAAAFHPPAGPGELVTRPEHVAEALSYRRTRTMRRAPESYAADREYEPAGA